MAPFHLGDYTTVAVVPFDTTSTPLPDQNDKAYASIRTVLNGYTEALVEAMKKELKSGPPVEQVSSAPNTAKTLILRGNVESLSPGSRAKRYLAGYGAGSAGGKISGELVDAKSGKVLVRFTQDRHSGGTFKFGGGSDIEVMRDSIHAVGEDVAHILAAFK